MKMFYFLLFVARYETINFKIIMMIYYYINICKKDKL